MSTNEKENSHPFEGFELIAVILLGLAAIATAVASYQAALYGGKSLESYSQANKLTTEGALERSRAIVEMGRDNAIDTEAMRLILEGDDATDTTLTERNYAIATYLYTRQISEAGYKALGLPPEARKAVTATRMTADERKQEALQEEILEKAMEKDLTEDETYRKEMFTKSQALFDQAEKVFKEGQAANQTGDKFQLVAVVYAISLFFGGVAQVFRHDKTRWLILSVGSVFMVGATIYLFTLPWTF
jgi:membrane protein YdbS with pleckstrin-like domain